MPAVPQQGPCAPAPAAPTWLECGVGLDAAHKVEAGGVQLSDQLTQLQGV